MATYAHDDYQCRSGVLLLREWTAGECRKSNVLRAIYGVRRTRRGIQRRPCRPHTLRDCACATDDEDGGQCHRRKVPAMQQR